MTIDEIHDIAQAWASKMTAADRTTIVEVGHAKMWRENLANSSDSDGMIYDEFEECIARIYLIVNVNYQAEKRRRRKRQLAELTSAMEAFASAAYTINDEWDDDLLIDGYPFEEDFESLNLKIYEWLERFQDKVKQETA